MISPALEASLSIKAAQAKTGDRLMETCQEFESLFVYYLLQKMRDSFPKMGYLHGGYEEEIYNSLMDQQVAVSIAEQQGLGLARMLYQNLKSGNRLPHPRSAAAVAAYRQALKPAGQRAKPEGNFVR